MNRPVLASAALAVALVAPTAGTGATFTDPADVTATGIQSFRVQPPVLSCTPRSPTTSTTQATITWTAQTQPGTGTGLLTQTVTSDTANLVLAPTSVGASWSLSVTALAGASNPTLATGSTRTITITVTSTLPQTNPAWSASSTQQLRVTRPSNNNRQITCL